MGRTRKVPDSGARPSARDVARLAGVSQSAVSRAFANAAGVSVATRERILRIADSLGYRPNALAKGLTTQRSGMVGIVTSNLANPFLSDVLDKILRLLRAASLQTLIFTAENLEELDAVAFDLGRYRVDGCFVISPHLPRRVAKAYSRLGPCVVLFNRMVPGLSPASAVAVDSYAAGRAVAGHLLSRGHSRTAFLHGIRGATTDIDRFKGFRDALRDRRAPAPAEEWGRLSYDGAVEATLRLLQAPEPPTALFCCNDHMAMGAVDAARHRRGLAVPGELAVIGFDDAPPAGWPSYGLTTVHQPVERILRAGVDLLLEQMGSPTARPRTVLMDAPIVIRATG